MGVAEEMCDFVFMIYEGKKVLDGTLASIQHRHGTDVLQVRFEQSNGSGRPSLENLPGVINVTDLGNSQELRVAPNADRQAILQELMRRGRIERFDIAHPSLHDIFLRIVKGESADA
jgi:ABC-2 type transport system ATP-binding protein